MQQRALSSAFVGWEDRSCLEGKEGRVGRSRLLETCFHNQSSIGVSVSFLLWFLAVIRPLWGYFAFLASSPRSLLRLV